MMFSPNGILKMKAKQALKGNWQTALLVCFIASLPGIAGQVLSIITGGDLATRIMNGMMQTVDELNAGMIPANLDQYLIDTMMAQFDQMFILSAVVSLVMAVITPALMLGLYKHLFSLLRGQGGEMKDAFSRMHLFFKAIGLQLLIWVKVFLWALPGAALMFGGSWISAEVLSHMDGVTVETVMNVVSLLTNASYVAMLVPVVMATFRYAMAPYHLADCPDERLRDCIDESKTIMKHRKAALFMLQFSFIGWHFLISVIDMFLQSTFGFVIGQTANMFMSLALTLYIEATVCCFYLVAKNPEQVGFRRVQVPYVQQENINHDDENEPLN